MARNTDKNAYWYVGIPKHSLTYQRLVADANDKGVSVPTLIAMRIDDFYKYGIASMQGVPASMEGEPDLLHIVSPVSDNDEEEQSAGEAMQEQEEANALAALEAWG